MSTRSGEDQNDTKIGQGQLFAARDTAPETTDTMAEKPSEKPSKASPEDKTPVGKTPAGKPYTGKTETAETMAKRQREISVSGRSGPVLNGPGRKVVREGELRDYEFILLQIWQRVLGNDRLTVNDDFFDSGGNSLTAIQSVVEFEAATGITIDLGELFRSPTIAALVAKIGAGGPSAPAILIPLQPRGDGVPLFCLLGIQVYRHLATSLGTQSPTFGVYVREEQALVEGATEGQKPETVSIGRLADAYFEIIRKACPRGPLRLAGLSYGGVVAMEVARRLAAAGIQVETVLLLDTILPGGYRRSRLAMIRALLARTWKLGIKGVARRLLARFRTEQGQPDSAPEAAFGSRRRAASAVEQEISRWMLDLTPPPWRVILVRANDNSAWGRGFRFTSSYGWGALLGDRLTTVRVDGDHLGILAPPHVERTAAEVHRLLGGS